MDIKTIHEQCDKHMSGDPVLSRNGAERLPQKRSHDFPEDFVKGLATTVNLNNAGNSVFVKEYCDARAGGMLRDSHVLEYVRSRRIDEGLDSLSYGGASVGI